MYRVVILPSLVFRTIEARDINRILFTAVQYSRSVKGCIRLHHIKKELKVPFGIR
jgi:hypothetical protein